MADTVLGNLVGGTWLQKSNYAGQIFFVENVTGATQFHIPAGWEDRPEDVWNHIATSQHWVNARTGRIVFQNPHPPAPQTYLDKPNVAAHLQTVERVPESGEFLYRRATTAILRSLFKEEEGYEIVQEDTRGSSIPDHVVLKIQCRAGGSFCSYDFMMVECKKANYSWTAILEHCTRHCANTDNKSGKVYAMVQVGMELQFHRWEDTTLTPLSNVLHLRNDVQEITAWAHYLKAHPLPAV